MENKTSVKDAINAFWGMVTVFFSNQKDNQMFIDLKIVKGVSAGIGYLIYIFFVLPLKLLEFILNPSWAWVYFMQRHMVSPLFEIDALTGSESPSRLLGEIYEKNLNYLKTTSDSGVNSSTLKPSISILERIMIFAKVRVIMTLLLFAFGTVALFELFSGIFDMLGLLFGAISGLIGIGYMHSSLDSGALIGGLSLGSLIGYVFWVIGGALIAYMMMFAVRFFLQSIKSIMFADRKMLKDFVDDTLHYTISKSIELYGEDVALKAYDLLLENVVTNVERYTTDKPHYLKLEHNNKESLKINDSNEM